MEKNVLKKVEEIQNLEMNFDEQLNQSELDDLRGGITDKALSDAQPQGSGHGTSNCCNSGW